VELRIKQQEQMQKRQQEQTEKKVQEEKIKQETRLQKIRAQEESRKLEIRERQAQAQALAKAKAEKERILNQTGMSIRAKEALIRAETKKAMEEALGGGAPLTETEFTKKLNDAAGDAVADKMGICMRNAGNDQEANDRCRT
jgi:membrane protein involved in colicin uptake